MAQPQQAFASGLHPVEIPHPDHHSIGSALTTPTFSPANKPTPLVGSWADYGWEKTGGEPNSATLAADKPKSGSTPLLPSTVSAFDERRSPLVATTTGTEEYISNLLHETAKLTEEIDDAPAPPPRSVTPPPAPQADNGAPSVRTTTYGRGQAFRQTMQNYQPTQVYAGYAAPPPPMQMNYPSAPQNGYLPPHISFDPHFQMQRGLHGSQPFGSGFASPPQPLATTYGGHLMPTVQQPTANGHTVSKFTPPPPPNIVFANELAGPESDTHPQKVGDILFNSGRRWVQKLEMWLSAHPRERPSAPCPAPEQYATIEAWLEKLGTWYEANFNGRKVSAATRGTNNNRTGGRGGRGGRGRNHTESSFDEAQQWTAGPAKTWS